MPHEDQFGYLSTVRKVPAAGLDQLLRRSSTRIPRNIAGPPPEATFLDPHALPLGRRRAQSHDGATRVLVTPIRLTLGAQLSIPTKGLPASVTADLKHAVSIPNPEFFRKQAQRFSTSGTPRYVLSFEAAEQHLRLPRGLLETTRKILTAAHIPHDVITTVPTSRRIDVAFTGELHPDQQAVLEALLTHETGILVAPPGTGKTVIARATIAARRVPTPIIVNRAELLHQWRERITAFLNIPPDCLGQLGAGRKKLRGTIDLVMLQSLTRPRARARAPSLGGYGLIIVDECHSVAAPAAVAATNRITARYWLGLTVTPFTADNMDELISMQLGPVRHTIDRADTGTRELIVHSTQFSTEEPGTDGASIQAMYG